MSFVAHASQKKPRRRTSPAAVFGEVMVSIGVLVLLFVGWQMWWNDWVTAGQQESAALDLSRDWLSSDANTTDPGPVANVSTGEPAVIAPVNEGDKFAIMYVPRFGKDTQRVVSEGVGTDVLNSSSRGVGHYPGTQMPGEVGNFAIASHRNAYGGGLRNINQLQLGDAIYIRTRDGWYTYRFRNLEYVTPSTGMVLDPVPNQPGIAAKDRVITLTSCNPLFSTDERIIAYGIFESFTPESAGPPSEISHDVQEWQA